MIRAQRLVREILTRHGNVGSAEYIAGCDGVVSETSFDGSLPMPAVLVAVIVTK
jgi:hypothetical protein